MSALRRLLRGLAYQTYYAWYADGHAVAYGTVNRTSRNHN